MRYQQRALDISLESEKNAKNYTKVVHDCFCNIHDNTELLIPMSPASSSFFLEENEEFYTPIPGQVTTVCAGKRMCSLSVQSQDNALKQCTSYSRLMASFQPGGVNRAHHKARPFFSQMSHSAVFKISDRMNHRQSLMIQGDVIVNYNNK